MSLTAAWNTGSPKGRSLGRLCTAAIGQLNFSGALWTVWCGQEDSNFHGLSATTTSTLRVYQFRHDRTALTGRSGPLAKGLAGRNRLYAGKISAMYVPLWGKTRGWTPDRCAGLAFGPC